MGKADELFAKETLQLIRRYGVKIEHSAKTKGKFVANFAVLGTSVKYRVEATLKKTDRVYVLEDPRHYSGPGTDRQAIEEYDRSDKVQRWEEKTKTVTIRATSLPGIGSYDATFEYDPEGYIFDHVRKVEGILDFLTDQIKASRQEKERMTEEVRVGDLKKAFAKL